MPNLLFKLLLFLSSYFPLSLIFAVQLALKGEWIWAGGCAAAGLLGVIGVTIYLCKAESINSITLTVESVSRRDGEAMSYIVTYLLPFLVLPDSDLSNKIGLGIFLLVLCILYVNSGMIHINPYLNLIGYHIYEITRSDGNSCAILTRKRIRRKHEIKVIEMGTDIYLGVDND